jgi:hypothetical protein
MIKQPLQWWLAELDQHGNAKLIDGPHNEMAGVQRAAHLFEQLGFAKGKQHAAARVEVMPIEPNSSGINHEAVQQLQALGLRP